ncbi:hypothetical protein J4Q44_G00116180, partial [Coregonus suidteri]
TIIHSVSILLQCSRETTCFASRATGRERDPEFISTKTIFQLIRVHFTPLHYTRIVHRKNMAETDPKSVQDLTNVVQTLLQQMQDKFQTMSDQIIGRIDEMSTRIDDLEKNIADLMTQAGVEEIEGVKEPQVKEGQGS